MIKREIGILIFAVSMLFPACARQVIHSAPARETPPEAPLPAPETPPPDRRADSDPPEKGRPGPPSTPETPETAKSPGEVAAIRLTDQARRYLDAGDAESAIRVLERSVALHPYNGEGYFLLAEAWLMKNNAHRALTFNRMAQDYLMHKAPSWQRRIRDQYRRILELKRNSQRIPGCLPWGASNSPWAHEKGFSRPPGRYALTWTPFPGKI